MSIQGDTLQRFVARHERVAVRGPKATCDVCGSGGKGVHPVEPGELRPTAAPWITHVCIPCARRLTPRQTESDSP